MCAYRYVCGRPAKQPSDAYLRTLAYRRSHMQRIQPFSDVETYRGALTRARNAAAAWDAKNPGSSNQQPAFAVGLVRGAGGMVECAD